MTFTYIFERQVGPSYYSQETDEEFYDTREESYEYTLSKEQVVEGLIAYHAGDNADYEDKEPSIKEQVTSVIKGLEGVDISEQDIDEAIEKSSSVLDVLNSLLYNFEDYVPDEQQEYLYDYWEDVVYNEWQTNS